MLPLEIPVGTTVDSLVRSVVPELHGRLVPVDAPGDALTVSVRIEGAGSYTIRIRGREMDVEDGELERPTLWLFTTARAVELFLADALGPRRFLPHPSFGGRSSPPKPPNVEERSQGLGALIMSDPRVIKRAAMASGRIELALRDVDGERLAIVLGFGAATRKVIDPEDADVVVETGMTTLERMLDGALPPQDALVDGDVTVRGDRLLALQLALAIAPFYPAPAKKKR
jgi:putative sterol carrier protein